MSTRNTNIPRPSVDIMTLGTILKMEKNGNLVLPAYQRNPEAWLKEDREEFLSGVNCQYFGEITVIANEHKHTIDDFKKGIGSYDKTDASHRINESMNVDAEKVHYINGKLLSEVTIDEKERFYDCPVVVKFYPWMTTNKREYLFELINSGKPLKMGEKLKSKQNNWLSLLSKLVLENNQQLIETLIYCGIPNKRSDREDCVARLILNILGSHDERPYTKIPRNFFKLSFESSNEYKKLKAEYDGLGDNRVSKIKDILKQLCNLFKDVIRRRRKLSKWWLLTASVITTRGDWNIESYKLRSLLKKHIDYMSLIEDSSVEFNLWESGNSGSSPKAIATRIRDSFCKENALDFPKTFTHWIKPRKTKPS